MIHPLGKEKLIPSKKWTLTCIHKRMSERVLSTTWDKHPVSHISIFPWVHQFLHPPPPYPISTSSVRSLSQWPSSSVGLIVVWSSLALEVTSWFYKWWWTLIFFHWHHHDVEIWLKKCVRKSFFHWNFFFCITKNSRGNREKLPTK